MKALIKRFLLRILELTSLVLIFALLPLRALRRRFQKRTASLWAGTPIINMGVNAGAERLLGVDARSLVYSTYYVTNAFDYNLERWYRLPVAGKLVPFVVFVWAAITRDRLHFYCDRGLLPSLSTFEFSGFELFTYRFLGIDVFFWTYGADVRSRGVTKALGEPNCCTDCDAVGRACICDDDAAAMKHKRLLHFSKAVFSMGDMIEYTPGSRNDIFFWPVDLGNKKYEPLYPGGSETLRIVHAPNHRAYKGTRFLIEAVEKLKAGGLPIELVLVEGLSNDKALEIYRSADLIFDQCLVGFHGYFAIEAMAMGKPVMCFIRKPGQYLLHPEECPLIYTGIDTLGDDIKGLAMDRDRLREAGIMSRRYVEKYFTPEAFAKRLDNAYRELNVA